MKIIVIEGGDGLGKFTQATMLADRLRTKGKRVALVEVPYRDVLTYRLIYEMLADGSALRFPTVFQMLQFANKLAFQLFVLPFLWFKNDYIVFDRWSLSGVVYGSACGANIKLCELMSKLLVRPNTTLVLEGPTRIDGVEDTHEASNELQRSVAELYATYCDGDKIVNIDATGTPEEVHEGIWFFLAWSDLVG